VSGRKPKFPAAREKLCELFRPAHSSSRVRDEILEKDAELSIWLRLEEMLKILAEFESKQFLSYN